MGTMIDADAVAQILCQHNMAQWGSQLPRGLIEDAVQKSRHDNLVLTARCGLVSNHGWFGLTACLVRFGWWLSVVRSWSSQCLPCKLKIDDVVGRSGSPDAVYWALWSCRFLQRRDICDQIIGFAYRAFVLHVSLGRLVILKATTESALRGRSRDRWP